MRKAIIKLINSWAYRCEHEWVRETKVIKKISHYGELLPNGARVTYRCTKCCEFKQKNL